jgi:hypothetical protein
VFSTACHSAALKFYLQSEKQRKWAGVKVKRIGWVEDDSHVFFGKKFSDENEM